MNIRYSLPLLSSLLALTSFALSDEASRSTLEVPTVNKMHITYLAQSREYGKSIDMYRDYQKQLGRHDFEVLEQMARSVLEVGARSDNAETQLLSIYGCSLAALSSSYEVLQAGILSQNMQTQLAALHLLARLQDDLSEPLLNKAMASEFLYTRLEAAYILAARKSRSATGQVESLMYKIPHQLRFFFPELFALIGTSDAVSVLKSLMDDPYHAIRIEAILSAARHGRDDLLPIIRASASHNDVAEQEACATALGYLKDGSSLKRLKKLSSSPSSNIELAALRSLYHLGDSSVRSALIEKAKQKNLFAIGMLGDVADSENTLFTLAQDPDIQVRFNAVMALLKKKDGRSVPLIKEFLVRDSRDLGFQPQSSIGNSLKAWKVLSSLEQHAKESYYDLVAISLSVREQMLRDALELSQQDFLSIVRLVFDTKQNELIPMAVALLENLRTPAAIEFLKVKSQTAGAPLIRAYCNLALFRLQEKGPYEDNLKQWILKNKSHPMIEFRPSLPWAARFSDTTFALTPEESSALLIESYVALADKHDEKSIDFLLDAMHDGDPKNRPVLAGILIKALQ